MPQFKAHHVKFLTSTRTPPWAGSMQYNSGLNLGMPYSSSRGRPACGHAFGMLLLSILALPPLPLLLLLLLLLLHCTFGTRAVAPRLAGLHAKCPRGAAEGAPVRGWERGKSSPTLKCQPSKKVI